MPAAAQAAPVVTDFGADFGVATLAAVAQANAALIEGLEAIGTAIYDYARDSLSSATSVARSMIEARNLADVVALNGDFARTAVTGLFANSARVSEISIRATSEVFKPLGGCVADTISKMSRPT